MKSFLKYGFLYAGIFATALGSAFIIQYKPTGKKTGGEDVVGDIPMTPGETLINSVLSYEAMKLNANIDMVTEDSTKIGINFIGEGSIKDLENIKVRGDLDLNLDGSRIQADLAYFTDTLAFQISDNYFKLKTDDLLAFIDMIPTYGVKMELPEDLQNISLETIESQIMEITEEDRGILPEGGYYYTMAIGELTVYVKTDENNNLKGLRTDTIFYKGMKFKLDVDLDAIKFDEMKVTNPLEGPEAAKYQNFNPVFNLFDAAMNFVKKDNAIINVAFGLDKTVEEETKNVIGTSLNIGFDKNAKLYSLTGDVYENGRTHSFLAAYQDEKIYASFHKVNVSIETTTISSLLSYVLEKVGTDSIQELLGAAMESMGEINLDEIVDKIKNTLGHISIEEEQISIDLDLSSFGLESKPFDATISWNNNGIKAITIHELTINNFTADLVLSFKEYVAPVFDKEIFVPIEPAAGLASAIIDLIDDKQFRVEFDALVDKKEEGAKDVTIDGGLQFDLDRNCGYGDMTIVDSDEYHHNIKADMFDKDTFYFAYNQKLKGKFTSQTLEDIVTLASDIVADPDEHFMELFGDLLNNMEGSPIGAIMNGDYGALLAHDIISNLQITDSFVSCDISLELLGIDMSLNIRIEYEGNIETNTAVLKALRISGIELEDAVISANLYLKQFDNNLEKSRLSPYDEYMDFSDIKVLLELGVKTSEFNYYHFTANAKVKLIGVILGTTLFSETLPLDIKIRNEKGNVKVAVEFTDLPIIALITPNDEYASAKNRTASIYYYEDTFYIQRREQAKEKGFLGIPKGDFKTYSVTRTCDTDYFLNNILEILLKDVLSCSSLIMDLIEGSDDTSTTKEQIHYEELINSFNYNAEDGYFMADINLAEIAHDKMFTLCTAKIYENKEKHILSGIDANVTLNLTLIKIGLELSLKFVDDYSVDIWTYDEQGNVTGDAVGTTLSAFESYYAMHKNDERNKKVISFN